ncbi:MAG: hypothetical protein AAF202_09755, partial [Pseudomonadota bacterium]
DGLSVIAHLKGSKKVISIDKKTGKAKELHVLDHSKTADLSRLGSLVPTQDGVYYYDYYEKQLGYYSGASFKYNKINHDRIGNGLAISRPTEILTTPSGELIYYVDEKRNVVEVEVANGNRKVVFRDLVQNADIKLTADGSKLIYTTYSSLESIDLASGEKSQIVVDSGKQGSRFYQVQNGLALTPDDKWAYVFRASDDAILKVDLKTGRRIRIVQMMNNPKVVDVKLGPEGKFLYLYEERLGGLYKFNLKTKDFVVIASQHVGEGPFDKSFLGLQWFQDQLMFMASKNANFVAIDLRSGKRNTIIDENQDKSKIDFRAQTFAYHKESQKVYIYQNYGLYSFDLGKGLSKKIVAR